MQASLHFPTFIVGREILGHLSTTIVGNLLESVVAIGDETFDLADRRRSLLCALCDLTAADAGFWAWGRGWPDADTLTPVAIIDFGFTDTQRADIVSWGLDQEAEKNFRSRFVEHVGEQQCVTSLREDLFSNIEWDAIPLMRRQLTNAGFGSWIHSVRYSASDTWSNLFLLRNTGAPEFGRTEADVIHVTLTSVPWMNSTAEEKLPPERFAGLTSRQRTVMLMLLDGLSRKRIATSLGIVEATVGDHIKAVFNHFGVGSVAELAALFLRGK